MEFSDYGGEKLYTHVAAAMEQLFTAEEELAECVGLSHGSIAIGASETALNCSFWIVKRVSQYIPGNPAEDLQSFHTAGGGSGEKGNG